MTATIVVSVIAVALALSVRPGMGLALLIAAAVAFPEYSRLPLCVVQLSVQRFMALALVLRHAGRWSLLRQNACDWFVIACYLLAVLSVMAAAADTRFITSTIGRGLDTVLMYLAARLCLATPKDFSAMKWPIV